MNEIIKVGWLAEDIREIWFNNPLIAKQFKPGQFLIVKQDEESERIPLTIVDTEGDAVRIVIQEVGYSTARLCSLNKGESAGGVVGPLGIPSEVKKYGKTVCMAGGIGAAPLKPVAAGLKELGNNLVIIEGVRSEKYLILEKELKELADEFILMSDDGTVGEKGLVTEPLKKMIETGNIPDYVFAVGPPVMMEAVSKITREKNIPLTVSLNPIMVDGTGMCGSCRVEVGGETKFACVDGPEFDGNKVNYKLLGDRLKIYRKEEEYLNCKCRSK
ncbi:sulfide/dihydroorotate dehydrogenase-like FAD/NAD-binding protein [Elusimicrobiota bacterium]